MPNILAGRIQWLRETRRLNPTEFQWDTGFSPAIHGTAWLYERQRSNNKIDDVTGKKKKFTRKLWPSNSFFRFFFCFAVSMVLTSTGYIEKRRATRAKESIDRWWKKGEEMKEEKNNNSRTEKAEWWSIDTVCTRGKTVRSHRPILSDTGTIPAPHSSRALCVRVLPRSPGFAMCVYIAKRPGRRG